MSATALPLVVAITGQMRESTEAALVGAAMLSVIIYPAIGMRLAPMARPAATPVIDEGVA